MLIREYILALALASPAPAGATESAEDRAARIGTIATAIAAEAPVQAQGSPVWTAPALAIAAYVKMEAESWRWKLEVHRDGPTPDRGGRATCLGRIHATWPGGPVPRPLWRTLHGTSLEATRRCVAATMRVLVLHTERCRIWATDRRSVAVVYVAYGTGHSCDPMFRHVDDGRRFGWLRAGRYERLMRDYVRTR